MAKIVRLTEADLTRLVKRVLKEQRIIKESMTPKDKRIKNLLDAAIEDADQTGYDDVYDWMDEVFSDVEDKLEGLMDIDDLRSDYGEYVQNHWEGEEDFDDEDEDEYEEEDED